MIGKRSKAVAGRNLRDGHAHPKASERATRGMSLTVRIAALWLLVFNRHVRTDPAAWCECADNRHGTRLCDRDQIIQDHVCHVLVECTVVAKQLQVHLKRFQFITDRIRNVSDRQRSKVRLACFRADRCEFGANRFNRIITLWKRVRKCLKCRSKISGHAWIQSERGIEELQLVTNSAGNW